MRLDGNYAFREIDGVTEIYSGMEAEEPTEYSKSRLRYFYFRIPLSIEWQTRLNGKGPLFFAVRSRSRNTSRIQIQSQSQWIEEDD